MLIGCTPAASPCVPPSALRSSPLSRDDGPQTLAIASVAQHDQVEPSHSSHHGDVLAARRHAPTANPWSLGLPSRSALEAFVWSTQLGTEELQLPGHEHEEAEHGLLRLAAHGPRFVAHGEPRRRHVLEPARRPEVRPPLLGKYPTTR